jgi:hypothetical protein
LPQLHWQTFQATHLNCPCDFGIHCQLFTGDFFLSKHQATASGHIIQCRSDDLLRLAHSHQQATAQLLQAGLQICHTLLQEGCTMRARFGQPPGAQGKEARIVAVHREHLGSNEDAYHAQQLNASLLGNKLTCM